MNKCISRRQLQHIVFYLGLVGLTNIFVLHGRTQYFDLTVVLCSCASMIMFSDNYMKLDRCVVM